MSSTSRPVVQAEPLHQQQEARIEQRLQTLYRQAADCDPTTVRSLLIVAQGAGAALEDHRQEYRHFVSERGGTMLHVCCLQPGMISFWPVRQLLEQLLPLVAEETPEIIQRYAAELSALHPQLMDRLGFQPALSLSQIALTPSERRSHRESEQAFRMINGLCQFVIEARQASPTLARGPLVLWWDELQAADRLTLLTFRRLNRWINQAHIPLVLVGVLRESAVVGTSAEEHSLPAEIAGFLDWRREHARLLERVRSQLLGEEIALPDIGSDADTMAAVSAVVDPVSGGPCDEAQATQLALSHFTQGQIEEGCAYALQATRLALFVLNMETVLFLGRQIIVLLGVLSDEQFDVERFKAIWKPLTAHDLYVALEFSVAEIHQRRDILIATWKAIALAQTFLEHHEAASSCYQLALELATAPEMRAQLCMYLGLITGKRLHRIEQARTYLLQGFQAINGLSTPEAVLEHGWLLNVSALMNYQQGHYRDGMTMVQNALSLMKPLHQKEATHLKVNLVSNISVLLEDTGRLEQALSTWTFFRSFLSVANEIFAKHYLFREGGLRMKAGALAPALECYKQSYEQAVAGEDSFHSEIIARACGYLCYRLAEFRQAHQWYGRSVELREKLGDYDHLPESLLARALCAYQLQEGEESGNLLRRARRLCIELCEDLLGTVEQARACLEHPTPEAVAAWEQSSLVAPGTKLNKPFYLMNLYPEKTAS
ncbi:MAG TPA: hypothetical protein VF458_04780 [Ktedonobacteraceae bacterium]